jgi:hypothetical protein
MNRLQERQRAHREAIAEQRRREDAAPRLRDEIAGLLSLRLRFDDIRGAGRLVGASYARPIVVESAPAHFEIRCMEPRCTGMHDLTYAILRALRQSEVSFAGTSNCDGMVGDEPCDRVLGYTCEAAYRQR